MLERCTACAQPCSFFSERRRGVWCAVWLARRQHICLDSGSECESAASAKSEFEMSIAFHLRPPCCSRGSSFDTGLLGTLSAVARLATTAGSPGKRKNVNATKRKRMCLTVLWAGGMQGGHGGRVHCAGKNARHRGTQRARFAEGGQGRRQGCFRSHPCLGVTWSRRWFLFPILGVGGPACTSTKRGLANTTCAEQLSHSA